MTKFSLSADTIAQEAHVGWGIVIVWGLCLFGVSLPLSCGIAFAFASGKEAIFDVLFEDTATRGNGWIDWAWWLVGIAGGTALLWWRR